MLVHTSPNDVYESISLSALCHIVYNEKNLPDETLNRIATLCLPYTPLDGMNEKGVGISIMQDDEITNQDNEKTDIITATIRLVLDYASDAKEAVELLKRYDLHSVNNANYHCQNYGIPYTYTFTYFQGNNCNLLIIDITFILIGIILLSLWLLPAIIRYRKHRK